MNKIQNTEKKLNLNAILKGKNEKIIRKDKVTKGNKTKTLLTLHEYLSH